MTGISNDLFLAILSMDAYNRNDPDAGRVFVSGSSIGSATVGQQDLIPSDGFAAQAYTWEGKTVIAYRGTDQLLDVLTGWITGTGALGPQAVDATQFYQTVTGKSIFDGVADNVILTGHSLGGGLAGLIAAVTGDQAVVFDAMPYEGAATLLAIYQNIALGVADPTVLFGTNPQSPLFAFPTSAQITSISVGGEPLQAVRVAEAAVAGTYAALLFPGPIGVALGAYVAANATSLLDSQNNLPALNIPGTGLLDALDLHSQALLVLAQWAQDNNQTAWEGASQQLMKALFGDADQIAQALDINSSTGEASDSAQLLQMIAYSALYNPGAVNWQLVFGDTAIRALFDDAGDLGTVMSSANVSKTLSASAQQIMDIALQFAGRLAFDRVVGASTEVSVSSGILSLSADNQTLAIDFSDQLWTAGTSDTQAPSDIVGRTNLIDQVFAQFFGGPAGTAFGEDISQGMNWLWQATDDSIVDRIVFAATDDALNTTLPDRGFSTTNVDLFAAGGSADKVTGSSGNDFIYGGDGNDELWGGGGSDLLAGGAGDDILHAASGDDYLAGGAGNDTAIFDQAGGTFVLNEDVSGPPAALVIHGSDAAELQSVERAKLTCQRAPIRSSASRHSIRREVRSEITKDRPPVPVRRLFFAQKKKSSSAEAV